MLVAPVLDTFIYPYNITVSYINLTSVVGLYPGGVAVGVIHGNYAATKAPYLGPGSHDGLASKYVPYVQFGPSIYF